MTHTRPTYKRLAEQVAEARQQQEEAARTGAFSAERLWLEETAKLNIPEVLDRLSRDRRLLAFADEIRQRQAELRSAPVWNGPPETFYFKMKSFAQLCRLGGAMFGGHWRLTLVDAPIFKGRRTWLLRDEAAAESIPPCSRYPAFTNEEMLAVAHLPVAEKLRVYDAKEVFAGSVLKVVVMEK
jgi:hypothetical protein